MTTKRKKVTPDVEADVIFRSNRECCCCHNQKRGDHIHHIDGNSSNSTFENLAYLCFDCHNEAETKGGLKKKLTAKAILKFRDFHYKTIEKKRANALNNFKTPILNLSSEVILEAAKNAIVIIEIEKIKWEYFSSTWEEKDKIINKLNIYTDHSNNRISLEVYYFLSQVADEARMRMPNEIALSIFTLVIPFFPRASIKSEIKQVVSIGYDCIDSIAFTLIYDSLIHTNNLKIAGYGFLILKFIYRFANKENLPALKKRILETYNEIESILQRPERDNLSNAKEFVNIFKEDLENISLSFPVFPNNLMVLFNKR